MIGTLCGVKMKCPKGGDHVIGGDLSIQNGKLLFQCTKCNTDGEVEIHPKDIEWYPEDHDGD